MAKLKNEKIVKMRGINVHVKRVFVGKIPLDKAMGNITERKLSDEKKKK